MSVALKNHMVQSPALYTLTAGYRHYIESMLPILRNAGHSSVININPQTAYLYRMDLEGFLLANGVQIEDHYLLMRVNDLDDSFRFGLDELGSILVPSTSLVNNIKDLYRGKLKK